MHRLSGVDCAQVPRGSESLRPPFDHSGVPASFTASFQSDLKSAFDKAILSCLACAKNFSCGVGEFGEARILTTHNAFSFSFVGPGLRPPSMPA